MAFPFTPMIGHVVVVNLFSDREVGMIVDVGLHTGCAVVEMEAPYLGFIAVTRGQMANGVLEYKEAD